MGNLCRCQSVDVFLKLEDCIVGGIRDNLERDVMSAKAELVEKLVQQESSDGEEERVNMVACGMCFSNLSPLINYSSCNSDGAHVRCMSVACESIDCCW